MKTKILIVMPVLLATLFVEAQFSKLKIGDKCPDVVINRIFNQQDSVIKLSDLKGKLVILDFWSQWCLPCIEAMAKMDSLQKKFPDKLYIITVTDRPLEETKVFWGTNKITRNTALPVACEDTVLNTLFEHESKPHVAWINGDGIVTALTTTQYVNAANIQTILDRKQTNWLVKETVQLDYTKPLIRLNDHLSDTISRLYYSAVTPAQHGVSVYKSITMDSASGVKAIRIFNFPLLTFIRWALDAKGWTQLNSRMILETKDSLRFIYDKGKMYRDVWDLTYTFCYEGVYPAYTQEEQIADGVLNDLERFQGIKGRVEKRKMKCWVMTDLKTKSNLQAPVVSRFKGYYAKGPVSLAKDISQSLRIPVINETTIPAGTRIFLGVEGELTLQKINDSLKYSGIRIKEVERDIEVFVIRD
jgi:thiol-disulfide isomerase/thioredoxin